MTDFQDVEGAERTDFDYSFENVVYALVKQPERIEKLFSSKDDRGYEMNCYDPVNRGREAITRNFDMMKDWSGGDNVEPFKNHW